MSPRHKPTLGIEHALLGFLREKPLHGYEMHQQLQAAQALGLVWQIKQAQLYALLNKIESEGLIAGETVAQDGRPPKRLLHLTGAGGAAFDTWLRTPVAHGRDLRIEFLAKLFWVQRASPGHVQQLITIQRETCRSWLVAVTAEIGDSAAQPYAWLVHQFRRGQIEAMLHWLDTCEATLITLQ